MELQEHPKSLPVAEHTRSGRSLLLAALGALMLVLSLSTLGASPASANPRGYCTVTWGNPPKSGKSVTKSNVECSDAYYKSQFSIWGSSTNGVMIQDGSHQEFCYRYWAGSNGKGRCEWSY